MVDEGETTQVCNLMRVVLGIEKVALVCAPVLYLLLLLSDLPGCVTLRLKLG